MIELGKDAGEGVFDGCDCADRIIFALLFQTAPMFEEFFPIEIGKTGPRSRLRLRHFGVISVYEFGRAPVNEKSVSIGDFSRAARRDEPAERSNGHARKQDDGGIEN